jgi:integrase
VDWEKKEITILRKNNERHAIIVNDIVMNILADYKHRSHPIPFGASYVDKRIVELRELSGIYFTCHDIRRAAGALLVRSGVRLAKVSKWMNHKDIKITYDHYYDIIDTERENIANKLEEKCLEMMMSPNIWVN